MNVISFFFLNQITLYQFLSKNVDFKISILLLLFNLLCIRKHCLIFNNKSQKKK